MALPRSFYERSSAEVARDLLGCLLIHEIAGERLVGRIVETEAYGGINDTASHASRGLTPRTSTMFGPAGHAYVYLIYGLYDMFNVVTGQDGDPAAVLIRACVPVGGEADMRRRRNNRPYKQLSDGPGKLTQALGITRASINGWDLCLGNRIWLEAGEHEGETVVSPRVGVDYAAPEDRDAPLRFRIA